MCRNVAWLTGSVVEVGGGHVITCTSAYFNVEYSQQTVKEEKG